MANPARDVESTTPELRAYSVLADETAEPKSTRVKWVIISLITLLWHLGLLILKPDFRAPAPPVPVDLQSVDPAKLEAIKNQWKAQKALLLSKDRSPVDPNTPKPADARYISDRNRIVEREQRAARTNIVPNSGGGADAQSKPTPPKPTQPKTPEKAPPRLNDLSALGVPLSKAPRETRDSAQAERSQSSRRGQGEEGDQALLDRSLPTGAENLLNTQESVYYSFYARIYDAIGPLWQSKIRGLASQVRVPANEYQTRVEVILDRDGNFVETNILRASGVEAFDRAVEDSWRRIPRFPNPPRDLLDANGLLRMSWTFSVLVDRNTGFQYVPPEREL